ncbi:uncharacterized protein LOC126368622 [Pectinophora gossypiella]|uniref:uncharacterized protein LOC126368622 n=1 Tax=Pectinophora gossypiella TaxID=13191 RepID=UPI00214EC712|nr:uncharacterized protein LOC126368622 [Pectinophora gossypiella]
MRDGSAMADASERERDAGAARAPTATVSSLKSEDSTEQLICKPKVKKIKSVKGPSVTSKSVEAGSDDTPPRRKRLVVWLGLAQVVLGALLVGGGALGVVRGAALARVGAGLWAGCVAVVAGVVGVLAGINDCYGLNQGTNGGPLLTAFMALSLLCLACGNSCAVLAATGLQRDTLRAPPPPPASFQDEMEAWTPVLTNIFILSVAAAHCVVSVVSVCAVARRVCACLRPRRPYDHNQFDPAFKPPASGAGGGDDRRDLARDLEGRLQGETMKKNKEEPTEFGSANSKERLVSRWLGAAGAPAVLAAPHAPHAAHAPHVPVAHAPAQPPRRRPPGVRKARKPPPVMLLPAHPASTLGRVPPCVMVGPRYATLPLPPGPYAHAHAVSHAHGPPPHAQLYYPVHDPRARRRRSPREHRERRRREGRERDSQLTRSLERIHRKRRAERERVSDADLKRTYTGLDRAYAEQFIAVCDSSRHAAEQHDSLASTSATSDSSHTSHE